MEINKFDNNGLTILWQAAINDKSLRDSIENEIQKRIVANNRFSREYLFQVSKIQKHAITVSFFPTTDSFNFYGANVTIDLLLDDNELEELSNNYSSNPPINTQGQLKAKALINDNLSKEQIERLENIGFKTNEILEILHL